MPVCTRNPRNGEVEAAVTLTKPNWQVPVSVRETASGVGETTPKRLHLRLIPGLRRDTHMLTCTRAHTYTGTVIRNIIINNKKPKVS